MNIEWKEPPARKYRKWPTIIEQLRGNPGQWALIGRANVGQAYKYAKQYALEIQIDNKNGSYADIYLRANEVQNA